MRWIRSMCSECQWDVFLFKENSWWGCIIALTFVSEEDEPGLTCTLEDSRRTCLSCSAKSGYNTSAIYITRQYSNCLSLALALLTLSCISRVQIVSTWSWLMLVGLRRREHWRVEVKDSPPSPIPPHLPSRWRCQESRVPLPRRKCPAGLWLRAGATHR